MRNLSNNTDKASSSLLCFFNSGQKEKKLMPRLKVKRILTLSLLLFALSSVLVVGDSFALFEGLKNSGREIFEGMREIIYAVAGFGIFAIAIGGFFGNINWKWLSAIIVGLIVIALNSGILQYMIGEDKDNIIKITDSLTSANGE